MQSPLDLVRIAVVHRADRACPEHLTEHRRVLEEDLALLRKSVEAGGDQGVNRLRDRNLSSEGSVLVEQVAVAQHPHELLGVQRVAAGTLEQQPLRLRRQHRLLQQGGDEPGRVRVGERREADGGVAAQPRAPSCVRLVQLGPCGTDDEERDALRPVGQVLQEREQRRVCPVDVLHGKHQWRLLRHRLQEPPPSREQLLLRGDLARLDPEQGEQPCPQPRQVVGCGQDRIQFRGRNVLRVRLEDSRMGLHDLAQRPERDPLPVRQAAALPPRDQLG